MKEIKEQIDIAQLLVKRVLGTIGDNERQQLEQWEKKDGNKALADTIIDSHNYKLWNKKYNSIDAPNEWSRFVQRMTNKPSKSRLMRLRVFKAVATVAAMFVIGLTLYFGYQMNTSHSKHKTLAVTSIKPGSAKAELILSGGEVVNLESPDQKVIQEGSLSIENQEGTVDYSDNVSTETVERVINTVRVPRGGEYKLVLADGTQVWINSDTELSFTVPFTGKERRVKLKGEAYFDVAHNANQPFIVESGSQVVEVLGTEFNVSAYPEDVNVVTTLVEGQVKVDYPSILGDNAVEYLKPNEQSVINKETENLIKQEVDPYLYTSWKDGRFKFRNEPLESFLAKVARWYDVDVFITDESIKDIRFTGDLPRYKEMTSILEIIEAEMSVHIEIENSRTIYVTR
ncbi:FecR family protein [Carboxylicivirga taeanensis]|uniref:FecR family protein n=1 Tax=Carboxylicivirga taeanensis TaxID=1416875 RepID=UPI003F6DE8D7